MIRGDSSDYDLLKKWCEKTPVYNPKERFSCTLNEIDIEEKQCLDYCVIILHSDQLKDDDDESIQDLILYKQGYTRLLNSRKNKLKKKESNDKRG